MHFATLVWFEKFKVSLLFRWILSPLHYPYAIPVFGWKQDSNLHFGLLLYLTELFRLLGSGIRTHDTQIRQTIIFLSVYDDAMALILWSH